MSSAPQPSGAEPPLFLPPGAAKPVNRHGALFGGVIALSIGSVATAAYWLLPPVGQAGRPMVADTTLTAPAPDTAEPNPRPDLNDAEPASVTGQTAVAALPLNDGRAELPMPDDVAADNLQGDDPTQNRLPPAVAQTDGGALTGAEPRPETDLIPTVAERLTAATWTGRDAVVTPPEDTAVDGDAADAMLSQVQRYLLRPEREEPVVVDTAGGLADGSDAASAAVDKTAEPLQPVRIDGVVAAQAATPGDGFDLTDAAAELKRPAPVPTPTIEAADKVAEALSPTVVRFRDVINERLADAIDEIQLNKTLDGLLALADTPEQTARTAVDDGGVASSRQDWLPENAAGSSPAEPAPVEVTAEPAPVEVTAEPEPTEEEGLTVVTAGGERTGGDAEMDTDIALAVVAPPAAPPLPDATPPTPPAATASTPDAEPSAIAAAEYVRRGKRMLELGDLASARLFFRAGAESGDSKCLLAMAITYDPVALQARGLTGVYTDPDEAIKWYEKALQAGHQEAGLALAKLRAWLDAQLSESAKSTTP